MIISFRRGYANASFSLPTGPIEVTPFALGEVRVPIRLGGPCVGMPKTFAFDSITRGWRCSYPIGAVEQFRNAQRRDSEHESCKLSP
jgi:hypothetical protein